MSWPRMSQCSYLPDRDPIKDSKNNKLCISEMCLIGRGEIRLIDKKKKKLWNFIIFMWKKNCFYHNSDLSILRGWSFQISTKNYYFDVEGKKKKKNRAPDLNSTRKPPVFHNWLEGNRHFPCFFLSHNHIYICNAAASGTLKFCQFPLISSVWLFISVFFRICMSVF